MLKQTAEELALPFSKEKCKLVPRYPRKYRYKLREEIGETIQELVTVSSEARILGLTWGQVRYW